MSRRDWDPLLGDLAARRRAATAMGGPDRLEQQRAGGRLDARARVAHLCDPGTFVELGSLVGSVHRGVTPVAPADGLVGGHGLVDGRPVVVGAEDFTVMAGSIGPGTAAKRQRLVELAAQERVPFVMLLDGVGERTANVYELRGRTPDDLELLASLSGLVPTVAVVMGPSAGHGALGAALADLVVMVEGAALFAAGPAVVRATTGEDVGRLELGGARVHAESSGVVHNVVAGDTQALDLVRRYLSYLPSNAWQEPPALAAEGTGGHDVGTLADVVPVDPSVPYDVRDAVESLADRDSVVELSPAFGPALVTALARLGGRSVAVVANQPAVHGGAIDGDAADKAAHLLDVADAFHLPVVFLTDTPGLAAGVAAERAGTLRRAARMLAARTRLRSPQLHVTLRRAYGLGALLMGARPFGGQTLSVALPGARTGGIPAESATASREAASDARSLLEHSELGGAYAAAETVAYDEIVEPAELRAVLLEGLRLASRRDAGGVGPAAHHGIRP